MEGNACVATPDAATLTRITERGTAAPDVPGLGEGAGYHRARLAGLTTEVRAVGARRG